MNIQIYCNKKPDVESLIKLYLDAGWGEFKDYPQRVVEQFKNALDNSYIITAYDQNDLVGFIRFFTDGFHDTHIIEFVVLKKYQNHGIGKLLFGKLVEQFGDTDIYINSTETSVDILQKYNFKKHHLVGMSFVKKRIN